MTGIDRLRTLAGAWDAYGLGGTLGDVARQIERERACDADAIENVRLIVGGVIDDMERHVSGVEGAEDSPVARWARELREALKSDASDERGAQNPSWHDPADAAGVTSDAPKVTRDPAEDVSMSAYDLLPADEREAIAWVREHGGLGSFKKLLDWVVCHCSTKQQLDFDFWLSGRVMHELGFDEDMADRDEVERRLLARLMPEGMEWPTVDGKPVDFVTGYVPSLGVLEAVSIYSNGACEVMGHDGIIKDVKEIHVATPKVLDADGEEIREKRDVWWICEGDERGVHAERLRVETICPDGLIECSPYNGGTWVYLEPSELYVNRPVPASDGRPLREGETVWKKDGTKLTVMCLVTSAEGLVGCSDGTEAFGEPVIFNFVPFELYHERPDSWERLEEEARSCTCVMEAIDLVRRAKKLAGVSE